ncbi:MAG: DegV family protein [Actinomycetes bacterium]|jgi:DegV family protein with EDD domain|nr:DegV family protein [Actinomycetes bacterium]
MSVRIVTDSTANLSPEQIDAHRLTVVTLCVIVDGVATAEVDLNLADFYRRLPEMNPLPTSSQPTVGTFRNTFNALLDEGDEVLGIFLSGGLSGTYETARMVATQVMAERPGAQIDIVDSKSTSMALTYPVLAAAKAAEGGATLKTCAQVARQTVSCARFLFAPHSLEYLRRGGRIGRASALLGSALKLVPVLGPENGVVYTWAKVRTFSKALVAIKDRFLRDVEECGGLKHICVHYIADSATAEKFRDNVIEPLTDLAVSFEPVSPVVGTHVGPAVGVAYQTFLPMIPEGGESGGRLNALKEKVGEYVHRFERENG